MFNIEIEGFFESYSLNSMKLGLLQWDGGVLCVVCVSGGGLHWTKEAETAAHVCRERDGESQKTQS